MEDKRPIPSLDKKTPEPVALKAEEPKKEEPKKVVQPLIEPILLSEPSEAPKRPSIEETLAEFKNAKPSIEPKQIIDKDIATERTNILNAEIDSINTKLMFMKIPRTATAEEKKRIKAERDSLTEQLEAKRKGLIEITQNTLPKEPFDKRRIISNIQKCTMILCEPPYIVSELESKSQQVLEQLHLMLFQRAGKKMESSASFMSGMWVGTARLLEESDPYINVYTAYSIEGFADELATHEAKLTEVFKEMLVETPEIMKYMTPAVRLAVITGFSATKTLKKNGYGVKKKYLTSSNDQKI
jgi:hypothetical protein